MNAVTRGARLGEWFRHHGPILFEKCTREQYRTFGRMKASQLYTSPEKQQEFMVGWFASNQRYFCFLADGPKRRITKLAVTVVCDKCGAEEDLEWKGANIQVNGLEQKYRECPVCEKEESA